MKTIELSNSESERWDDTGAAGAAFRRELVAREQERANRLGTSVEICHLEGHVLEVVLPEQSAAPAADRIRALRSEGAEDTPMQSRVVLLNTSILTAFGSYTYRPIALDYARELAQLAHGDTEDGRAISMGPLLSAVGHESTAQVLSLLLGVPVPMNRIQYTQEPGDLAVVFKLRGRAPEGKILSVDEIAAIGYDFGLIRMGDAYAKTPEPPSVRPKDLPPVYFDGSAEPRPIVPTRQ